jgi:hypothetical protein
MSYKKCGVKRNDVAKNMVMIFFFVTRLIKSKRTRKRDDHYSLRKEVAAASLRRMLKRPSERKYVNREIGL